MAAEIINGSKVVQWLTRWTLDRWYEAGSRVRFFFLRNFTHIFLSLRFFSKYQQTSDSG